MLGALSGDLLALRESSSQWNRMSASLQADIAEQPAMLKGGTLRDYQMTVSSLSCPAVHMPQGIGGASSTCMVHII